MRPSEHPGFDRLGRIAGRAARARNNLWQTNLTAYADRGPRPASRWTADDEEGSQA